ncbi:hypothetical protein BJY04DRAFT_222150 [Aspergillus karnatakaensis]|uniref:uncharacterized protein n=1 Tax=Aspergillus karnatakaensis TaxID=1810916 RepID=UPI003CCD6D5B
MPGAFFLCFMPLESFLEMYSLEIHRNTRPSAHSAPYHPLAVPPVSLYIRAESQPTSWHHYRYRLEPSPAMPPSILNITHLPAESKWTGTEFTGPLKIDPQGVTCTLISPIPRIIKVEHIGTESHRYRHDPDSTIGSAIIQVVGDIARYLHDQGCSTYEVSAGYWVPTVTWRIRIQVLELAVSPRHEWRECIRTRVQAYIDPRGYRERNIRNQPNFSDWRDWNSPAGDDRWVHFTSFGVYRSIPFLTAKNGAIHAEDWNALVLLKTKGMLERKAGDILGGRSALKVTVPVSRKEADWISVYQALVMLD